MRLAGYILAIVICWLFVLFGSMTPMWGGIASMALVGWYLLETFAGVIEDIRNDVREIKTRLSR